MARSCPPLRRSLPELGGPDLAGSAIPSGRAAPWKVFLAIREDARAGGVVASSRPERRRWSRILEASRHLERKSELISKPIPQLAARRRTAPPHRAERSEGNQTRISNFSRDRGPFHARHRGQRWAPGKRSHHSPECVGVLRLGVTRRAQGGADEKERARRHGARAGGRHACASPRGVGLYWCQEAPAQPDCSTN